MYDPSIIVPLVSTLRLFLSSASVLEDAGFRPKTAIVASTIRNQTTFDAFVAQAGSFASSFPVFLAFESHRLFLFLLLLLQSPRDSRLKKSTRAESSASSGEPKKAGRAT